jgi:UTP--glucose-1-phosphate uridylyltransferase|tara:strand:+ start:5139 stop:5999 length:861 start_codon:yes stop_codon:yes gene_type:complete
MGTVRDAVIVAAGLGTRMLPASAYMPKELLPLVDMPVLHHLIFEAKEAGCDRIHIITSPNKDFTSLHQDLNDVFPKYDKGSTHLHPLKDVEVFFHIQHEQKGLGHAIMMARNEINGPFLVLLGDNILTTNHSALNEFKPSIVSKNLVDLFDRHGQPCASVYDVGIERVSAYGIVSMDDEVITSIVEKPTPETAPSTYALCGRYIYGREAFELLDQYTVEEFGEMQSIELLRHWMDSGNLRADVLTDSVAWYDSGVPLEWLKSQIDHALRRPEYAQQLHQWLKQRFD